MTAYKADRAMHQRMAVVHGDIVFGAGQFGLYDPGGENGMAVVLPPSIAAWPQPACQQPAGSPPPCEARVRGKVSGGAFVATSAVITLWSTGESKMVVATGEPPLAESNSIQQNASILENRVYASDPSILGWRLGQSDAEVKTARTSNNLPLVRSE